MTLVSVKVEVPPTLTTPLVIAMPFWAQAKVSGAVPVAVAVNDTVAPAVTVCVVSCCEMAGGVPIKFIVRIAVALVVWPKPFVTTTL